MKKEDLNSQIKIITPSLIRFARALCVTPQMASELIADAYSVYFIKNADALMELDLETEGRAQTSMRKRILFDILKETY